MLANLYPGQRKAYDHVVAKGWTTGGACGLSIGGCLEGGHVALFRMMDMGLVERTMSVQPGPGGRPCLIYHLPGRPYLPSTAEMMKAHREAEEVRRKMNSDSGKGKERKA